MMNHRDILSLWPSFAEVARDLSAEGQQVSGMAVVRWAERLRIPPNYWPTLVKVAQQRGFASITLEALTATYRPRAQEVAA